MDATETTIEVTAAAQEQRAEIRRMAEHAPAVARSPIAQGLAGWWTTEGWFVCARDAARIMERGCGLPKGSEPAWIDEPFGVCVVCSAGGAK